MKRKSETELTPDTRPKSSVFGAAASAPSDKDARRAKFAMHLRALNRQFAAWVRSQETGSMDELWLDGVRDYETHAAKLKEQFSDVLTAADGKSSGEQKTTLGNGLASTAPAPAPAAPAAPAPAAPAAPAPSALFRFGAAPSNGTEKEAPAPTSTAPKPMFSFPSSAPAPATDAPKPANPFGASFSLIPPTAPAAAAAAPPPTTFGSFAPPPTTGGGDDGEDEDAEPEEATVVEKNNEDAAERLFESKSKLSIKSDDGTWNEVGIGSAIIQRIRKSNNDEASSLVFRNESTGKVVLNSPVFQGIKPMVGQGKPNMIIVTVYMTNGKEEGGGGGGMVSKTALFRFGSEVRASEFKQLLENLGKDGQEA